MIALDATGNGEGSQQGNGCQQCRQDQHGHGQAVDTECVGAAQIGVEREIFAKLQGGVVLVEHARHVAAYQQGQRGLERHDAF